MTTGEEIKRCLVSPRTCSDLRMKPYHTLNFITMEEPHLNVEKTHLFLALNESTIQSAMLPLN